MSRCAHGFNAIALAVGVAALMAWDPITATAQSPQAFAAARNKMVESEIIGAGVTNKRVIQSMRDTPRHEFVRLMDRPHAYYDMAMPIGEGQTISPPFIVAYMTEQLDPQPTDVVLEIGTGSGYQAAVLSPLVKEVYSIEIVPELGRNAAQTLKRLGYKNVFTRVGDGYQGWPDKAPFDKIIVTCSPEKVPQALVDQLRDGGRLIIPLGERYQQMFYLFRKEDGKLESEALRPTLFVPMTGAAEQSREKQPDPANPRLVNGSFEEFVVEGEERHPKAWHYVRQAKVVDDELAPNGQRCLVFSNKEPGRGSQALQGFPVDGRVVKALDIMLRIRGQDIYTGQSLQQLPALVVTFYDKKQNPLGERGLGPWHGTFDWRQEEASISVPPTAAHGIVRIGLFGAVGEIAFDNISIAPGE